MGGNGWEGEVGKGWDVWEDGWIVGGCGWEDEQMG